MNLNEEYLQALKSAFDLFQKQSIHFVEITDISDAESKGIVSGKFVTSPDVEIDNIFLQGVFSKNGMLIIPKVGSKVFVHELGIERSYIMFFSEIEKIIFENGKNGGIVKVQELTDKLNVLENQVNTILNTLKSVSVALAPAGTFPFAPIFKSIQPLQTSNKRDLENEFIKH